MRRVAVLALLVTACAVPPPPVPPPEVPALPELPPTGTTPRRMMVGVEVPDAAKAAGEVESALKSLGGYVTGREVLPVPEGAPRQLTIGLMVDSRQADALASKVKAMGTLLGQASRIDDVTTQMVTLNARLAGLRGMDDRMRAWGEGTDRDCAKVGELERERVKVVEQIATLVAEQRAMESRAQYAAMAVRLSEPTPPPPAPPSFAQDVLGLWSRALARPGASVRDAAVVWVAWLPAIVLAALVAGGIIRRRRGR